MSNSIDSLVQQLKPGRNFLIRSEEEYFLLDMVDQQILFEIQEIQLYLPYPRTLILDFAPWKKEDTDRLGIILEIVSEAVSVHLKSCIRKEDFIFTRNKDSIRILLRDSQSLVFNDKLGCFQFFNLLRHRNPKVFGQLNMGIILSEFIPISDRESLNSLLSNPVHPTPTRFVLPPLSSFCSSVISLDVETNDWTPSNLTTIDRVIEIAWVEFDINGEIQTKDSYFVKPDGFEISDKAINLHGISNQKANALGLEGKIVFTSLLKLLQDTMRTQINPILVGHNINFDIDIISREIQNYLGLESAELFSRFQIIDTMKVDWLRFLDPEKFYQKRFGMNLRKTHEFLSKFQKLSLQNNSHRPHQALDDALMSGEIFFGFKNLGIPII